VVVAGTISRMKTGINGTGVCATPGMSRLRLDLKPKTKTKKKISEAKNRDLTIHKRKSILGREGQTETSLLQNFNHRHGQHAT
jgi:hypothetical protein